MITILLVEDDRALAAHWREGLESQNFRVIHATSVAGAIEILKDNSVDLVVTDVFLEEGDSPDGLKGGLAVISYVIANVDPRPKIIAASGLETQAKFFDQNFKQMGSFRSLQKPIQIETLLATIDELFQPQKDSPETPKQPADNKSQLKVAASSQTEKDLQDAIESNQAMLELLGATSGVWDWKIGSDLVAFTPGYRELLGYKGDDVEGLPNTLESFSGRIHADDREGVWAAVNRAIHTRNSFIHQYRIRNASGNYTWVRSRAAVSYGSAGDATRMVGSTYDITAQLLAQDREKFVKISVDLFGKMDPETGRFTMLSPNWPDVVGYSTEEMMRRTFFDNALPEDHEAIEATLRKLRSGKAVRGFVTRFAHKEEGVIYLEWNADSPTPNSSEIYVTVRDVTDSDQAKFQVMAKVVPDVFYIIDLPDQHVIYQNRDRGASIGYTSEQVEAMDDMMTELVHPDDLPRLKKHYQEMAEAVDGEVVDVEYRLRHVDGFYRSFFGRDAVYRRNIKGEVQQIVGTATDVTRMREYTEKLEHSSLMLHNANRELSHSNADLEQFAYAASHDLQEPLRAIHGFVQLLQSKYLDQLDDQAQGYIDKAMSGVSRMGSVIDGLLNYAKIGQSNVGFGSVDLIQVVNDAKAGTKSADQISRCPS